MMAALCNAASAFKCQFGGMTPHSQLKHEKHTSIVANRNGASGHGESREETGGLEKRGILRSRKAGSNLCRLRRASIRRGLRGSLASCGVKRGEGCAAPGAFSPRIDPLRGFGRG